MKVLTAEIIAIGTELLLGDIVNTNAAYLARELAALGINTYRQQVVGDNPERLQEALTQAYERADMVITSGGLGPTQDDVSKETAAAYFGLSLKENPEAHRHIEEYMLKKGKPISPNNWKQAMIPEGATVFQNHNGTAPAFAVEAKRRLLVMLPGPPSELVPLFQEQVIPYLKKKTQSTLVSKTLHICGIGESAVEYRLKDRMQELRNPTLAPYAKEGTVDLRITAKASSKEEAVKMIEPLEQEIRGQFGTAVYGTDGDTLESVIVEELRKKGWTVTFAESCTAGMAAGKLVDYPGASDVLKMGFITYSNEAKIKMLGVKPATLKEYGAVSEETAIEMARGAAEKAEAETAVSITGLAGPGGGSPEVPVGTIWIGIYCQGKVRAEKIHLSRNRNANRHVAVITALNALRLVLSGAENNIGQGEEKSDTIKEQ